jgi:class 3 adenylate cyclase
MLEAHFALLASIVRYHDGAAVKTVGDVLASFADPTNAVKRRWRCRPASPTWS